MNRKAMYMATENHLWRVGRECVGTIWNMQEPYGVSHRCQGKTRRRHATVYRQHSLVANILPIIIVSKVLAIEDSSSLNEGPYTSEYHMPGVPTKGMAVFMCVCACMYTISAQLTGSAD